MYSLSTSCIFPSIPPSSICQKQIFYLQYQSTPLSSYYNSLTATSAIKLTECNFPQPSPLSSKLTSSQTLKKLPRLPSNNILILSLIFLQMAYDYKQNQNQQFLNKIKRYAYDETIEIVELLDPNRKGRDSQMKLRKLIVEFFHLIGLSNQKNKVEKFVYKYPIVQCILVLLFRKILVMEGVIDAGNLQLPVPTIWIIETLCKVFEVEYKVIENGYFEIGSWKKVSEKEKDKGIGRDKGRLIYEDASYIYKVCERETEDHSSVEDKQQEYINKLLDDTACEEIEIKEIKKSFISPQSRLAYSSRPPSNSKTFQYKTKGKAQEPVALFPKKQQSGSGTKTKVIEVNSTPLSFTKTKPSSQTQIPASTLQNSSYFNSNYGKPTQSSHPHIPQSLPHSSKQLSHQRNNSGNNLFNIENKSNYYSNTPPPIQKTSVLPLSSIERQKSYQGLPEVKIQSFSPEKRSIYNYTNDKKVQEIPRVTSPLSYFNYQSLLSKNNQFMDRRWNLNLGKGQTESIGMKGIGGAGGVGIGLGGAGVGMGTGIGSSGRIGIVGKEIDQYRFGNKNYKYGY